MNPSWQLFRAWTRQRHSAHRRARRGTAGRRLRLSLCANDNDSDNPSYDGVIYSDDNGATWQFGGGPDPSNPANAGVNEAAIVQLPDGAIYMNSRLKYADNTAPARGYSISYDGGITWTNVQYDYSLPVSIGRGFADSASIPTRCSSPPRTTRIIPDVRQRDDDLGQLRRRTDLDRRTGHQLRIRQLLGHGRAGP